MSDPLARYATPAMSRIWSERYKLEVWALIERSVAEAQEAPESVLEEMRSAPVPSPQEVAKEEAVTRHDVVAFLHTWQRGLSPDARKWVHKGLTSSDVVDTANALRMNDTSAVLMDGLTELLARMAFHAVKHKGTIRVARTHGQTAEVSTWGYRVAELTYAVDRARTRLKQASWTFTLAKLSGPVGDYKRISSNAELDALADMDLFPIPAASQIVMRDVYADFVFALGQIATVIEAIALEIRLSSRTDTGEVAEGFADGQTGSSSMPHKRNPIKAEQLCGLARMVRAQLDPVWQGVATHHERDISHSSVERIALVTAATLTDYMINSLIQVIENLQVNKATMFQRVVSSPELGSAHIRERLIEQGLDPEAAWKLVNRAYHHFDMGGYDTLTQAFTQAWNLDIEPRFKTQAPDGQPWTPAFVDIILETNDPSKMLGDNEHVFDDLRNRFLG